MAPTLEQQQIKRLPPEEQYGIRQAVATMAAENMPLTEQAWQNLIDTGSGAKAETQVIQEIIQRYKHA